MQLLYRSPICDLLMSLDGRGLCSVRLLQPSAQSLGRCGCDVPHAEAYEARVAYDAVRWLDAYFAGAAMPPLPQLQVAGTPFQLAVWRMLKESVPQGSVVTYGQLAQMVGCRSAQAVGQALGGNPLPIFVPCHRVVAAHGIGGFAFATDIKRALLRHENVVL